MFNMTYTTEADLPYWQSIDRHLPLSELHVKIGEKRCYILRDGERPVGVLRYNLFWDLIPFLTLIELDGAQQRKGLGTQAVRFWEEEMRSLGYKLVMTSTMVEEGAQHFYRKLGYKDCGCLIQDFEPFVDTMEMFMMKRL